MIIKGLKKFAGFTACVIVLSGCSAGTKDGTKEASDGGLSATSDGVSSSSVDTGSMERDGSPESVKVVLNGQAQEPISAPVTCQLEDDDTAGGTERVVIISQLVEAENRNGWKGWQVVVNDGDPPSLKGLLAADRKSVV